MRTGESHAGAAGKEGAWEREKPQEQGCRAREDADGRQSVSEQVEGCAVAAAAAVAVAAAARIQSSTVPLLPPILVRLIRPPLLPPLPTLLALRPTDLPVALW